MPLNLKLSDLSPNLGEGALRLPLAALMRVREKNEQKWGRGGSSPTAQSRKEKLRQRLKAATNPRTELTSILKAEVGSRPLLLDFYMDFHGESWLPPFDDSVAAELLSDISTWKPHRRRQAARLFFEKFEQLPAASLLASQLRASYADGQAASGDPEAAWVRERTIIFQTDGPHKTAQRVRNGEALQQLMDRHGIPSKGAFAVKLRQVYLLESLKRCSFGDEPETLSEIELERTKLAGSNLLLGAAALQEIINRVECDGRGQWPESWQKWIIRLGCDPRLGRHTAEGAKWWGWASDSQLRLAQQGVAGLTLGFFIKFLEGSMGETDKQKQLQFALRSQFLMALLKAGKIQDTRLCFNWAELQRINASVALNELESARFKDYVAHLSDTTDKTSMICLKCSDDIFIVEGTHTFGLRVYRGTFPIGGFWERTRSTYRDKELRSGRDFIPHDPWGRWVEKFFDILRRKHHLEDNWRDVRI